MSWKAEERQLETPSCWRFTDCLHFIVCWSPVSPVCFTCVGFLLLYHFFSTVLTFPRWPEHHHSASSVAWIWIRKWHMVLVNRFFYQEPFRRLKKKSFLNALTHYRTTVAYINTLVFFILWTVFRFHVFSFAVFFFILCLTEGVTVA